MPTGEFIEILKHHDLYDTYKKVGRGGMGISGAGRNQFILDYGGGRAGSYKKFSVNKPFVAPRFS